MKEDNLNMNIIQYLKGPFLTTGSSYYNLYRHLDKKAQKAVRSYNLKALDYFLKNTPLATNWQNILKVPYSNEIAEGKGIVRYKVQKYESFTVIYEPNGIKSDVTIFQANGEYVDKLIGVDVDPKGNGVLGIISRNEKEEQEFVYCDTKEDENGNIIREIRSHTFLGDQASDRVINRISYKPEENLQGEKLIYVTPDYKFLFNDEVLISDTGRIYNISEWRGVENLGDLKFPTLYRGADGTLRILACEVGDGERGPFQTLRALEVNTEDGTIASSRVLARLGKLEDGSYDVTTAQSRFNFKYKDFDLVRFHPHKNAKILIEAVADGKDIILVYDERTMELTRIISSEEPDYSLEYTAGFYDNDMAVDYRFNGGGFIFKFGQLLQYIAPNIDKEPAEYFADNDIQMPNGKSYNFKKTKIIVTTKEGGEVPVSLTYDESLVKFDSANPLHLRTYGVYGVNRTLFDDSILTNELVKKGFVCAVIEARGTNVWGSAWRGGWSDIIRENTLSEIMEVIGRLVEEKYTSIGNIALEGEGVGGFSVASLLNKNPEYFKAAILHSPYVTIQYGNCEFEDHKDENQSSICKPPIDEIAPTRYPAIYVRAEGRGVRKKVDGALKYVDKLTANNEGEAPILLEIETRRATEYSANEEYYDGIIKGLSFLEAQFGIPVSEEF